MKIFTRVNEAIAFQKRKLKCNGIIYASYTRNGVVHLKKSEWSKPIKVFFMCEMYDLFPNFNFIEEESEDLFHDASQITGFTYSQTCVRRLLSIPLKNHCLGQVVIL